MDDLNKCKSKVLGANNCSYDVYASLARRKWHGKPIQIDCLGRLKEFYLRLGNSLEFESNFCGVRNELLFLQLLYILLSLTFSLAAQYYII